MNNFERLTKVPLKTLRENWTIMPIFAVFMALDRAISRLVSIFPKSNAIATSEIPKFLFEDVPAFIAEQLSFSVIFLLAIILIIKTIAVCYFTTDLFMQYKTLKRTSRLASLYQLSKHYLFWSIIAFFILYCVFAVFCIAVASVAYLIYLNGNGEIAMFMYMLPVAIIFPLFYALGSVVIFSGYFSVPSEKTFWEILLLFFGKAKAWKTYFFYSARLSLDSLSLVIIPSSIYILLPDNRILAAFLSALLVAFFLSTTRTSAFSFKLMMSFKHPIISKYFVNDPLALRSLI